MSESQKYPYATYLNVKFPALTLIDVPSLVKACTDRWYNQTLCKINDSVVRLGVMQGEYHWHKHDNDDEFFFVLEGHFFVDLEGETIDLQPQQGYVVPKGIVHRTRAPERDVILMVETAAVMKAWEAWYTALGSAVVDPGNPVTPVAKSIASNGSVMDGPAGTMATGYTIIQAESLDKAAKLAQSCPVLQGGAAISVFETFDVM